MSDQAESPRSNTAAWQRATVDLACCLRFYSRLPVPVLPWESDPHARPDFPRLVRVLPLAGLVLGLLPALVLAAALTLDLGSFLAATLAVATAAFTTGAFHEDGLADTADSFGGATRERRLDIMKDSRIGSFGASALTLVLALRIGALAALASRVAPGTAMAALLMAASLSRTSALALLVHLPPARIEGASYAVGRPSRESYHFAVALAAVLALLVGLLGGLPLSGVGLMLALSAVTSLAFLAFSTRHIGGQTGDVAGAAQQVAEIAALIGLLTVLRP